MARAFKAAASFEEEKQRVLEAIGAGEDIEDEFENASDELKDDRDVVLAAVSASGLLLEYCSDRLQNDITVVKAAVQQACSAIEHASDELRGDRELVLAAVRKHGLTLQYASEELRGDREVVLEAIACWGHALKFATDELRDDREVILAAVKQWPETIDHATTKMACDREVLMHAFINEARKFDCLYDQFFSELCSKARGDKEVVLMAVRWAPREKQARCCYDEANNVVKEEVPWEKMFGAAQSSLACEGEQVPVLTVSLSSSSADDATANETKANRDGDRHTISPANLHFQASLLSGSSFSICMPRTSNAASSTASALESTTEKTEPTPPSTPESPATVNDLAILLLEELRKEYEEVSDTERIFMTFVKGDEEDFFPISVWDFDRPLSDFFAMDA